LTDRDIVEAMSIAGQRVQLWMYSLAVLVLTASLESSPATAAGTGAAAAMILITALLVSRTFAGATIPGFAREPIGTTLRRHARRTGVLRQCDPDAAGHARPRAPGHSPLS
jgi:hypothetical protein